MSSSGREWEIKNNIMMIGEYQHKLDEKNRMAIPAKFRVDLKKGAVVTRGLDNCLTVYPLAEWKKLADKLAALPISQGNSRAFARFLLSGAADVSLDGNGRILLSDYLKSFAHLNSKDKVIVIGMQNRLEIWSEKDWDVYRKQTEKDSIKIAEELENLNI